MEIILCRPAAALYDAILNGFMCLFAVYFFVFIFHFGEIFVYAKSFSEFDHFKWVTVKAEIYRKWEKIYLRLKRYYRIRPNSFRDIIHMQES